MSISKIWFLFTILFFPGQVFADLNLENIDLLFQARDHQLVLALTPIVDHLLYVSPSFTETYALESLRMSVEYGLSKRFSVSIADDYGSATTRIDTSSTTVVGASNILITGKGSFELDSNNKLLTSFVLSISPGRSNLATNRFTGGNNYTPQIAYQHRLDPGSLIAVAFNSTYYGLINYEGGSTTPGDFASAIFGFYEKNLSGTKFGGRFGLSHDYSGADFANNLVLGVYSTIGLTQAFSITPQLSYIAPTDALAHKNGVKELDHEVLLVDARYAF